MNSWVDNMSSSSSDIKSRADDDDDNKHQKETWLDFTQESSMHGLKNIHATEAPKIRRYVRCNTCVISMIKIFYCAYDLESKKQKVTKYEV